MAEAYCIYRDEEEESFTLCHGVEGDGALTIIHNPVAGEIRDEGAARLFAAAPLLLEMCERALAALNTAPMFMVPALHTKEEKCNSYKIAGELSRVVKLAKEGASD